MVAESTVILRGRVGEVRSAYDENERRLYTYVEITVEKRLKGDVQDHIVLRQIAGRSGDRLIVPVGTPEFIAGEEVVLFLRRIPITQYGDERVFFTVHNLAQGKYAVETDAKTGEKFARFSPCGADFVKPQPSTAGRLEPVEAPAVRLPLKELEAKIAAAQADIEAAKKR